MNEPIFNAQSIAVRIEHILYPHALACLGDADRISNDPIGFMNTVLSIYEKDSEEKGQLAADFWDNYKDYQGQSLYSMGEKLSTQLANDIKALFE